MSKKRQLSEGAASPIQVRDAGEVLAKYLNAIEGHPELNQAILARDLQRQFAQGSMNFEQSVKAIILFIRLEDLIAAFWASTESDRVRQCACGCGVWFFAHPRHMRYCSVACSAACRTKRWELRLTEGQKERRRDRMKRFMSGYYDKNFKA